jgi:hypothetical protein
VVSVFSFSTTGTTTTTQQQSSQQQKTRQPRHVQKERIRDDSCESQQSDLLPQLSGEQRVKVKDLLSDLPTPTLLIELSLAESALRKHQSSLSDSNNSMSLNNFLYQRNSTCATILDKCLDGTLFVHTTVIDTSDRDKSNRECGGSGKSLSIGRVDSTVDMIPGGAYLGIGLANHHVGGYYWARGMGMGASLPAHGIAFRSPRVPETTQNNLQGNCLHGGEIYWKNVVPD